MRNYEEKIDRCLAYIKQPSQLNPTGDKSIVYLVYNPEDTFLMRGLAETYLRQKAEFHGFKPVFVSIGNLLDEYMQNHDLTFLWTDPNVNEVDMYNSIKQAIEDEEFFENKMLAIQEEHLSDPQTLIVIKDVEMLHPFYLMGVLENKIYNKIKLPIIVLYPGESQGTARAFLGVYNQDGNYRSVNF